MTIKQLLETDGTTTIKWLYVNIVQFLSYNHFIVADTTGLAIMQVEEKSDKQIEVGQGLKMIKPRKIDDDCFIHENQAVKTKPMVLPKPDKIKIEELTQKAANLKKTKKASYTEFNQIIDNYKEDDIVDAVLVLVSTISRLINGKFGDYRIVNILDSTNSQLSLNMYAPHLEKLRMNEVFVLTNLKKSIMKHDTSLRLVTTKFTNIKPANLDEEKLFGEYKVVKHVIEGYCIMSTDLFCYQSCPKHNIKLNVDGFCILCKTKRSDSNPNFHCTLHIESLCHNDLTPILIFKNLLNISSKMSELKTEDLIEQSFVNQKIKIHYKQKGETNIATKLEINNDS